MMRLKIYFMLLPMLLILNGCMNDDWNANTNYNSQDIFVTLHLSITQNSLPQSKAISESSEQALKRVEVLVFKVDGASEAFAYKAPIMEVKNTYIKVKLKRSISTEAYRLVVLNVGSELLTPVNPTEGEVKSDVLKKYIINSAANWDATSDTNYSAISMFGETNTVVVGDGEVVFNDKSHTSTSEVPRIKMMRALSRIDVGASINGTPIPNFKLSKVIICNTTDRGYLVDMGTATTVVTPNDTKVASDKVYGETNTYRSAFIRDIYVTETPEGTTDANAPYVIIVGQYKSESTESFYRIDFRDNGNNRIPLKRNTIYRIDIQQVNGPGFSTIEAAKAGKALNVKSVITAFDGADMGIAENGAYYLKVNKTQVQLGRLASTDLPTQQVAVESNFMINGVSGWTVMVKSASQTWLDAVKLDNTTLVIKAKQENTGLYPRQGEVILSAGAMKLSINVEQMPLIANDPLKYANSYIVKPNGTLEFQAVNVPENTSFEAKLLWETSVGLINQPSLKYDKIAGRISLSTGNSTGNAVVVLREMDGTIKWSWHIWVTNDKIAIEKGYSGNSKFMDRNLGALGSSSANGYDAHGLHYQWGRKDPFPSAIGELWADGTEKTIYNSNGNSFTIKGNRLKAMDNSTNVDYSIKYPDTFITSTGDDWLPTTPLHNELWSENKTIFDPCPYGWKVPHKAQDGWGGVTANLNSSGLDFPSTGGWLPFAGWRDGSGALKNITKNGYYYYSYITDTGKVLVEDMYINGHHTGEYGRNGAKAIRCVRVKNS